MKDSTTTPLKIQVDGQTAESWSEILAQFEDANIYQSWAYGASRWGERNLSHFILRRDDQVVAAAQLRLARLPLLPAGVAYLRWGPLCQKKGGPLDPSLVQETFISLRNEYTRRRGLSLQIIPNAYADEARGAHHRDPQTGWHSAHRVITGVADTTSAHCARKRR